MIIQDIAEYLEDQARGTVGTNIFMSTMPSSPNNCIAIYDQGEVTPDGELDSKVLMVQIIVRNTSYTSMQTLVDNIVSDLHQIARSTGNPLIAGGKNIRYSLLRSSGYIGKDDTERHEYSLNFEVYVER